MLDLFWSGGILPVIHEHCMTVYLSHQTEDLLIQTVIIMNKHQH